MYPAFHVCEMYSESSDEHLCCMKAYKQFLKTMFSVSALAVLTCVIFFRHMSNFRTNCTKNEAPPVGAQSGSPINSPQISISGGGGGCSPANF